jgi:3D (Asp-Asp-Asp) domain-containing protein
MKGRISVILLVYLTVCVIGLPSAVVGVSSSSDFWATAYYCCYESEMGGTQTVNWIISGNTYSAKASFLFGGFGVSMQGTGRTGPNGEYIHYDGGGGSHVHIDNPGEFTLEVRQRYTNLGVTDFAGFGNLALTHPEGATYSIGSGVIGANLNTLIPWYSIAVDPDVIPLSTIGTLVFESGSQMNFLADDTGGRILGKRIDVYVGEGEAAINEWSQTGGNRWVTVVPQRIPTLYAGTSNPGLVCRYLGGKVWQPISTEAELDHAYAVLCLTEYEGHLYAGTMSISNPQGGVGRVYRYEGGTSWTLVGDNLDNQVCSLAVYKGDLYAGTAWNGMKLYRYEGDMNWPQVIHPVVWDGTRALYVSHGSLFMGDIGWDRIGHYDGSLFFHQDLTAATGSCIYDFEDYGDYVYAAAYVGRMWRSTDGVLSFWDLAPGFGYYDGNIWELETFQGSLYMAYANGELRVSNIPDRGAVKYTAPDGIISMESDGINLYFGTGGEAGALYGSETDGIANIYRYDGISVTRISHSDEFGGGVQVLYHIPSLDTTTKSGVATFSADTGRIEDLAPVDEATLPTSGKPNLIFPHGFFIFKVKGLGASQTVTITITLPFSMPVRTEYWMWQTGTWFKIQIGSDNGDNAITITITDGSIGDGDGEANGIVVDPGGPGFLAAPPVGGEWVPINRLQLMAPWMTSIALMTILTTSFVYVRRRKQRK